LHETKFELPVYYLGLSRLFPIGEAKDDSFRPKQMTFANDEHREWFVETYKKVLYLNEDIETVSGISIGETENKRAVGINTQSYDYLSNSAGQDNVGQILMALLSFKQTKSSASSLNGGLLLIDEFDATLHPAAQNELFNVVFRTAKQIGFQAVFTTHSISLLRHINAKIEHNNESINDTELYYFTTKNGSLEIERNGNIFGIEDDLMVQSIIQNGRRIPVYTEDNEARWFLQNLACEYLGFVSIPDVSLGCQELLKLLSGDVQYFGNVIVLFDGDVSDSDILSNSIAKRTKNILKLPGNVRPEQVMHEYILSLPQGHPFLDAGKVMGFSLDYFKQHGPDSYQGNKERDNYKQWFHEHQTCFDALNLYSFWAADNQAAVDKFKTDFKTAYNIVAGRLSLPQIS
jgi:hypothetical protein